MADPSYRFGPFLLDRTGYRALRGTDALELTPKLLDLLFYLAGHAGKLVTKEELLDALWAGQPSCRVCGFRNARTSTSVETIPTLGTGKVDLRMVRQIATEYVLL